MGKKKASHKEETKGKSQINDVVEDHEEERKIIP